jgi:hypothetical protein
MRTFLTFLMLIMISVSSFATSHLLCDDSTTTKGGDFWPWGREANISLTSLEGTWIQRNSDGEYIAYSFDTIKTESGQRIVKVKVFDYSTCETLMNGKGVQSGKLLNAAISGSGQTMQIRVHNFRKADVSDDSRKLDLGSRMVTVMSVVNPAGKIIDAYQLFRVSSSPTVFCD